MIDPRPHKIGAFEWYHDGSDGQRTHTWAEKPCPAPAILCESVEQADELLAAREALRAEQSLHQATKWLLAALTERARGIVRISPRELQNAETVRISIHTFDLLSGTVEVRTGKRVALRLPEDKETE